MALAERLPKIHLHCHLEGSLRGSTFVELADKRGVPLRYHPVGGEVDTDVDRNDPYGFKDFPEFLLAFAAVNRSLAAPADYARLAREFVEDALDQGVVYGELFVSPSVWSFFNKDLDVREAFESISGELRAARPRATFKLIADVTRNFGHENAMKTAALAATLTDLDVIGVGLGGDEIRFPAEMFEHAFAYARSQGLHTVAHAGEAAGPHSVRNALDVLGAERIGHGITALQDPQVVAMLAERKIPLEICPTSNVLTGTALNDGHAFVEFDKAGCIVTIDADDPTMFGTSIAREYAFVEKVAGGETLARFVRNAIDASFAEAAEKRALRAKLDEALAGLPSHEGARVGA